MLAGFENPIHLLFIVAIAMLVFGPGQIPRLARSAGEHARGAREGIATFRDEFSSGMDAEDDALPAEPAMLAASRDDDERA